MKNQILIRLKIRQRVFRSLKAFYDIHTPLRRRQDLSFNEFSLTRQTVKSSENVERRILMLNNLLRVLKAIKILGR